MRDYVSFLISFWKLKSKTQQRLHVISDNIRLCFFVNFLWKLKSKSQRRLLILSTLWFHCCRSASVSIFFFTRQTILQHLPQLSKYSVSQSIFFKNLSRFCNFQHKPRVNFFHSKCIHVNPQKAYFDHCIVALDLITHVKS